MFGFSFPSEAVKAQATTSGIEGFCLLQAWWWLLTLGPAKRGSVLTPLRPIGSPPMVVSAPSSPVYEPVGGWLPGFVSHWLCNTDDTYVLRTISEGIRLDFLERPPLAESAILFTRNAKREAELCRHVEEMVSKEALELAPLPSVGFYSNLFLAGYKPKASKSL